MTGVEIMSVHDPKYPMRLFEFIICEKEIRADVGEHLRVVIHVDPSPKRLIDLLKNAQYRQVRGLLGGRNLYFWDAFYATHQEMSATLGIEYRYENSAHVWLANDEVRLDFLDRPFGDLPDIPEMARLLHSPEIFFDARSQGYISGPEFIEAGFYGAKSF